MRISDWSSDVCTSDLAASAGYGTGEGIRLEGSWTHRNLLPPEGALTFRGVLGTLEQGIGATLRRSNAGRSEEHTSELQSLMRISYAVFCLKKKKTNRIDTHYKQSE